MTLLEPPPGVDDSHQPAFLSPEAEAEEESSYANQRRRGFIATTVDTFRGYGELRKSPYGVRPVTVITVLGLLGSLQGGVLGLASPEIRQDLNISLTQLFALQSTVGLALTFANVIVGYYADRKNRVHMASIGIGISGVAGIATSFAVGKTSFNVPIVVGGAGDQIAGVPFGSLIADYYPVEERGRAYAAFGSLGDLTDLLTPPIIGLIVYEFGWRSPYLIFSIPLILFAVYFHFRMPNPTRGYFERKALGAPEDVALREEPPVSFGEGWRTIWAVKTIRRNFVAQAITSGAGSAFGILYATWLAERFGLNVLQRSLIGIPAGILGLAGVFYGGGLVDRILRRRPNQVMLLSGIFGLISAGLLAINLLYPPLWVIVIIGALSALASGLVGPAFAVINVQLFPSHVRSSGEALRGMISVPGLIILYPIASQVGQRSGLVAGMGFCIPFLIVGAFVSLTSAKFVEGDLRQSLLSSLAGAKWRASKEAGSKTLLVASEVNVFYDQVQTLFDVDFDVQEGEIIALLGTNGAGKSTLLRAISGTQEADSGTVLFDGRDITHMPPHEVARAGVIHMPGGRGVFPGLTVRENLLLGTWLAEDAADAQALLLDSLTIFPSLRGRLDALAGSLSGGEQQQLSLAQAFMGKPKLLCIDELSLGLSPSIVGELLEIVRAINARGVTIVVVEQSINVALSLATRCVFMDKGEIRFSGKTADLIARPDILRAVYVTGGSSALPATAAKPKRNFDELLDDAADNRPILEVKGLTKRYGGITAVDNVSFDIRQGEAVGLIGPNGSGKTTTLELISGYQKADEGSVIFDGVDITHMKPEERAERKLVRRFQDARLFPALTVHETLMVALEAQITVKNPLLLSLGVGPARRSERRLRIQADRLIEILELGAFRDKLVRELSTGLRRIVDIACVLAAEPKVLLLDEPSSGIAQAETEGLGPLFTRIRFETGCALVIIEHDMPLISAVADELIAFESGAVVLRDTPDAVLRDPRVQAAYLGDSDVAVNRSGVN